MREGDETASSTSQESNIHADGSSSSSFALVILWSRDEPARLGEAALFDPSGGPRSLGRGASGGTFVRQRPGRNTSTGPLRAAKLSRAQLLVSSRGDALEIKNTGRAELRINGRTVTEGRAREGDLVELRRRLLLLCTRRPQQLPSVALEIPMMRFPFGEPDAFGLVGESPAMWSLRARLQFFAQRDLHVLILGESGTGKELVAQALHGLSTRRNRALISRNAATIPEALVDAELFGNARGYPNPGMRERAGLVGSAHESSLFLDEIGELPHEVQAHLLRVMDLGEYQRLGEGRRRVSNLRIIAATNRAEAELKHDFLARFPLRLKTPSLGERLEDIPLLVRHMTRRIRERDPDALAHLDLDPEGDARFSPSFIKRLVRGPHETHVRALHELLWRALVSSRGGYLDLHATPSARDDPPAPRDGRDSIVAELERCGWVMERAWRNLGLRNRYELRRLLQRHQIKPPPSAARAVTREELRAALDDAGWVKERAWRALGLGNRFQLTRLIKKHGLTRQEEQ